MQSHSERLSMYLYFKNFKKLAAFREIQQTEKKLQNAQIMIIVILLLRKGRCFNECLITLFSLQFYNCFRKYPQVIRSKSNSSISENPLGFFAHLPHTSLSPWNYKDFRHILQSLLVHKLIVLLLIETLRVPTTATFTLFPLDN